MGNHRPSMWTIDDYDGEVSWQERGARPPAEYNQDEQMSTNQYHMVTHMLYQLEGMTDELMAQMDNQHVNKLSVQMCHDEGTAEQTWRRIKENVENICMEINHEVENTNDEEELVKTWNHRQQTHVVSQWSTTTDDECKCWHERGMNAYFSRGGGRGEGEGSRLRNQRMISPTKKQNNWCASCQADSGRHYHIL